MQNNRTNYKNKDAWLQAARKVPSSSIFYAMKNSAVLEVYTNTGKVVTKSFWMDETDHQVGMMPVGGFIDIPLELM